MSGKKKAKTAGQKPSAASPAITQRQATPGRMQPSRRLDTFPNPNPARDFLIHIEIPEFTCLCPLTGQPDFATIVLDYIADTRCVELKSLKLYMWSFRDQGTFHEAVTNQILDDMVAALEPRFFRVTAKWYVRGGIFTNVIAEHQSPTFAPKPTLDLAAMGAGAAAKPTA